MTLRVLVCLLLALVGSVRGGLLPDSCVILPSSEGRAVLRQCSRGAPTEVSEFWQPSVSQILEMESRLPEFLRRNGHHIETADYFRQYIGVVSHSQKRIYLNAFSRDYLRVNP